MTTPTSDQSTPTPTPISDQSEPTPTPVPDQSIEDGEQNEEFNRKQVNRGKESNNFIFVVGIPILLFATLIILGWKYCKLNQPDSNSRVNLSSILQQTRQPADPEQSEDKDFYK